MTYAPKGGRFFAFELDGVGGSPRSARAYWTPERKRAANPVPMRPVLGVDGRMETANAAPATDPKQADLGQMPFAAGGKLFYTMDGVDYVASGNIFMRNNLLLTAAHCIQDEVTGNLGENYAFERGYTGELASETLSFKTVALKENWYLEKDNVWDYAIVILNETSTVASPLRYTTEDVEGRTVTAFGYPSNYSGGEQMMFVNGSVTTRRDKWIMNGNKMGPGASGGAWVLEDGVTAIGLTSFGVTTAKGSVYAGSPKFDAEFDQLYQYALTLI